MSLIQADQWQYVAEGGANVVYQYRGPLPSPFSDKVLRLRKQARSALVHTQEDFSVSFTQFILSELLPEDLYVALESVRVSSDTLKAFAVHYHDLPTSRHAQDQIDVTRKFAVLAESMLGQPNADHLPVLSIEIKPKWGFLPSRAHLSIDSLPVKTRYCRLCTHRYYKNGDSSLSKSWEDRYCPLDLYSGQAERVRKAIRALTNEWKQGNKGFNNLKLFVDGQLLEPKDSRVSIERIITDPQPDLEGALTTLISNALLESKVLRRLKHLQESFDPVDIEGLQQLTSFVPNHSLLIEEPSLAEYQRVAKLQLDNYLNAETCSARELLIAYLLSASFKDCSLLIKVKPGHDTQIKLIDLDCKSMKKLPHYFELDQAIVQHFKTVNKGEELKSCL